MPHIIAIDYSDAQRRQLHEKLTELAKKGWPLSGKYDASNFETWNKLLENAVTPGLFAEREVITVENAELLKEFPEGAKNFAEKENADCIIILLFAVDLVFDKDDDKDKNEGSGRKKVNPAKKYLKHIENLYTHIQAEAQIPPWKRQAWLMSLAKEQGFKISPDAAQLLGESIEAQEELRAEISKLALYADGREIKISDVEKLSFDEGGRALLIFLDGVCENKVRDVVKALNYLRNSPVLPVLAALTNRLRPALFLTYFQGKNADEAIKILGTKNYALNKAKSALKNFGDKSIKKFMAGAVRLSFLEKTNNAEGWQGFEVILWELMMRQ